MQGQARRVTKTVCHLWESLKHEEVAKLWPQWTSGMPLYFVAGYVWLRALVEKIVTLVSLDWKSMSTYLRQRKYVIRYYQFQVIIRPYSLLIALPTYFLSSQYFYLQKSIFYHCCCHGNVLFFWQWGPCDGVATHVGWPGSFCSPNHRMAYCHLCLEGDPTSCATHCKKLFQRSKNVREEDV